MTDAPVQHPVDRLPLPLMASALIAFAALYISGKFFLAVPILAALFVLSYILPLRLPDKRIIAWTLRILAWTAIIFAGPPRHATGSMSIVLEPDYVHMFGYLCASELVLRGWTHSIGGPSRGEALLIVSLIFTAASNTQDRTYIPWLAPFFVVCVLLSLRTVVQRDERAKPLPRRPSLLTLRTIIATIAIGASFSAVFAITAFENRIMSWASQLVRTRRTQQSEIGLSDVPRLQAVFNPKPSMDRVLRIDGSKTERYIRAMCFDVYVDHLWMPRLRDRVFQPVTAQQLSIDRAGESLRFTGLTDVYSLVLAPLNAGALESLPGDVERDRLGSLRFSESLSEIQYEVIVAGRDDFQGPLCIALDADTRRIALAMPASIDPRVTALANTVAGDGPPLSRVMKLAAHLRSHHAYSLEYDPGNGDPISNFVLGDRAAHCEYFASSLVMLARAAGVPARLATGYYAHEADGNHALVVRQQDAHAWAECWIEGTGWTTFDATPAGGRPDQLFPKPSALRKLWERITDLPGTIGDWIRQMNRRTVIIMVIVALTIATVVGVIRMLRAIRVRRRSRVSSRSYAPTQEELVLAGERFESWLKSRGQTLASNRTWREHVTKLDSEAGMNFVSAYDRARFGEFNDQSLSRVNELLEELSASGQVSNEK